MKRNAAFLFLGSLGFLSVLLFLHGILRNPLPASPNTASVIGASSVVLNKELLTLSGNKSVSTVTFPLSTGILSAKDILKITYDLHGVCLLDGPSSAITLEVSGKSPSWVSLSRYGQNCLNGTQSVDIPFSHFEHLSDQELAHALSFSFWYPTEYIIDIQKVIAYNSSGAVLGLSSDMPKEPVHKSFPHITPIRPSPYAAYTKE